MADHDQFTGARLSSVKPELGHPRLGTPPDKFGMLGTPLRLEDQRQAVMIMLFPPEALRDQPLPVIEQVIDAQAAVLLKGIALEIYRSYTSDPLDAAGARNAGEAMIAHANALAKGGGR